MAAVPASIIPPDEARRIAAVKRYEILDTPADGSFDRVTAIAARRFNVPISIISIVDKDRICVHRHFHIEKETDAAPALAYLQRLCDDLSRILAVPVEVDGENGMLPTTSIQPVGLIVNELVTNAAKHGAGKVNVTYRCRDGCTVTVCDEGSGLPAGSIRPRPNPVSA